MKNKHIGNRLFAGFAIILFIVISIMITINGKQYKNQNNSDDSILQPLQTEAFKHLKIEGKIKVSIQNGSQQKVLQNPNIKSNLIDFKQSQDTLVIHSKATDNNLTKVPVVIIHNDELNSIHATNKASVHLKDYHSDNLMLNGKNEAYYEFDTLNVQSLSIQLFSKAKIEGRQAKGNDVTIHFDNKSSLGSNSFNFDSISGKVLNNSWIIFKGDVKSMNITTDKNSRINKY